MNSTASPEFKKLTEDIFRVWQQIGFDLEPVTTTNEERVEGCIDADHLTLTIQAKDSQEYLRGLIAEYGYDKTLTLLCRHVHL